MMNIRLNAEIAPLKQGSDLWLHEKKHHISGTEASSVINPECWEVLARNKSTPRTFQSPAMIRGNKLEGVARASLQRKSGLIYMPAVFIDRSNRMMASLDGITLGRLATCEIKCPEKGKDSVLWKLASTGKIPHRYRMQMQHGLLLSGAKVCHYWVYDEMTDDGIMITIEPDVRIHAMLIKSTERYWQWRASRECEKVEVNSSENALLASRQYTYWLLELEKAKARLASAEDELKKHAFADCKATIIDSVVLEKVSGLGEIDYARAVGELLPGVNLEKYRKKPSGSSEFAIKVDDAESCRGRFKNGHIKKSA